MTRVYMISTYDEHGAEDVRATLDPSKLEAMLTENVNALPHMTYRETYLDGVLKELRAALATNELYRDGRNLSSGWGGYQLHIFDLE